MAVKSKPLFHPEVIRQELRSLKLPARVADSTPKLQHWADLISSGRVDDFKETDLLPDFITDIFCGLLGFSRPAGPTDTFTLSREKHVDVDVLNRGCRARPAPRGPAEIDHKTPEVRSFRFRVILVASVGLSFSLRVEFCAPAFAEPAAVHQEFSIHGFHATARHQSGESCGRPASAPDDLGESTTIKALPWNRSSFTPPLLDSAC